jgi:hypothetical protein
MRPPQGCCTVSPGKAISDGTGLIDKNILSGKKSKIKPVLLAQLQVEFGSEIGKIKVFYPRVVGLYK